MTAHAIPRPRLHSKARGTLLLPFALLATMIVGALAFVSYVLWPSWPGSPIPLDAPEVPITVAGVLFDVPPAAIRVAVQRHPGPHERVDLALLWPSLTPPPSGAKAPDQAPVQAQGDGAEPSDASERLFVTIAGLGTVLLPAERLRSIYPRYVEAEATAGPDGLAILPFRPGTPYAGEDLVYLAANPEQFFARCTRQAGVVPATCIHERTLDGAEVTLRFPRGWLDDWRSVAAGFDRLIAQLHPQKG